MPRLSNARHELFAQAIAKGNTLAKAHALAGYSVKLSTASRLGARPDIRGRINELIDQWSDDLSLSMERVLQELSRVAFSDIRRVVQWQGGKYQRMVSTDPEGAETVEIVERQAPLVQLLDSGSLDAATAASIAEVSQGRDGTIRIKLHPKLPALQQLTAHLQPFGNGDKAKIIAPPVNPLADTTRPLDFKRLNQEFSLPVATTPAGERASEDKGTA